jgi:hypothetical protein
MVLNIIYVYQYHAPLKNSPKNSTNFNFEVYANFQVYFVTHVLHMLKFFNVCWIFKNNWLA